MRVTVGHEAGSTVAGVEGWRAWRMDRTSAVLADVALAAVLSGVALVEALEAEEVARPLAVLLALLQTAPLALRRRAPFVVYLVMGPAIAVYGALGQEISVGPVGTFVALYGLAAEASRRLAFAALALQALGITFFFLSQDRFPLGDVTEAMVLSGLAWTAGMYVRTRRLYDVEVEARVEAQEQSRARQAMQAVAEERARMARDLHDVVGHGVTLMVVQAGAGRRVAEGDPGRAITAFRTIEESGRQALGELDRLLGILRPEGEEAARSPASGLDQLPALAERCRHAGLPVEVMVDGEMTPMPPALESALYRVAQEALTNTLRHAGPARATVALRRRPGWVELEVVDDGAGALPSVTSGGRGLAGIRERVEALGGEVDAGAASDGGFAVRCRIPLEGP